MTQMLLQRQTPRAATGVGVQQVRAPVAERTNNGGNQQHALRLGEECKRVEEQRRKRRVGERQAARAEGVQLVAVRAVREGDSTQAVHVNIVSRRVRHVVEGVEGNQDEQQVRPESTAAHAGDAVKEAATRRFCGLFRGFFGDFFLCRFFRGGYRGCGGPSTFYSAFSSQFRNRCSSRASRSPRDYRRYRLGVLLTILLAAHAVASREAAARTDSALSVTRALWVTSARAPHQPRGASLRTEP